MPDRKYEKSNDRNYTLLDAKQRVIDLMANNQPLPEAGIYDEPVRYFKANEQWCSIIFGWLDWLEDVAGWQDAEDELHPGIQAILIFEEGIEAGMATKDDIRDGMYEAFNRLALQIASGTFSNLNFSTDANGIVTPASPDAALPDDDPDTGIDETESARSGGVISIRKGINNFLSDLNILYGSDASPDTALADAQFIIEAKYKVDPTALSTAMTEYWADRAAAKAQLTVIDAATLDSALYCKGIDRTTITTVIVGITASTIEARQNAVAAVNALTDEQISDWFDKGSGLPSTAYLDYTCVPIPAQTLAAMVFTTARNTTPLKANHRMKFIIDGYALDADGDIQDAFYYRTAAGVNTFTTPTFTHSSGNNLPSQNQVPYSSSHHYEYTIDLGNLNAAMVITLNKHASMNATGLTYPTPFSIQIIDLGEYTV